MLELSCLENEGDESWELYEKKGRLHLVGGSERGLIYALTYLSQIPPREVRAYLGRHTPRFPYRVLHPQEKIGDLSQVLRWGFNALIGDYPPNPYVKVFPFHKAKATDDPSRHELLKDLLLKELKQVEKLYKECIFLTPGALQELNFEASHAILAFEEEAVWDELKIAPPLGTPLMPYLKLEALERALSRMNRHPFVGIILQTETLGSHLKPAGLDLIFVEKSQKVE